MKTLLLVGAFIVASHVLSAQMNSFRLGYDVAVPLGQLREDFINVPSWRGISMENRWGIDDDLTLGFLFGWQVFAQRVNNVTGTTSDGLTTFNGNQFRTINTFPIQANAHYYFGKRREMRPWVGMGLGTAYSDQSLELGFFQSRTSVWSFSVTPQVGVDMPVSLDNSVSLYARYNYFIHSAVSFNYSYLVIGLGINFLYW